PDPRLAVPVVVAGEPGEGALRGQARVLDDDRRRRGGGEGLLVLPVAGVPGVLVVQPVPVAGNPGVVGARGLGRDRGLVLVGRRVRRRGRVVGGSRRSGGRGGARRGSGGRRRGGRGRGRVGLGLGVVLLGGA